MAKKKKTTNRSNKSLAAKFKKRFGKLRQNKYFKAAGVVAFVALFSWVGSQVYGAHAASRRPSDASDIVLQYTSLAASGMVQSGDEVTNELKPTDITVTGDGSVYCVDTATGKTSKARMSEEELSVLFDTINTPEFADAEANQAATAQNITNYDTLKAIIVNNEAEAHILYNSADATTLFDSYVASLQPTCSADKAKEKVKKLPEFKEPNFKSKEKVALLQRFSLFKSASAAGLNGTDELNDYTQVNEHRDEHVNKDALYRSGCLTTVARNWASTMANQQKLYHNPNLVSRVNSNCGSQWTSVAENVGFAPDEATVFAAFVGSCGHHSNIDDVNYGCGIASSGVNYVGIGAFRDSNNRLWVAQVYATCNSCGGAWTSKPASLTASENWENLGGNLASGPTATSMNPGHLAVFASNPDGNLVTKSWTSGGGWSGWSSLGGCVRQTPQAESWADGRMDVYVRGCQGNIRHYAFVAGRGWIIDTMDVPFDWRGGPGVSSPGAGSLNIVIRAADNTIRLRSYTNSSGWSGWQNLGGGLKGSPDSVSWGPGRIDVFAKGLDNQLWQKAWTAGIGWSGWVPLGGWLYNSPSPMSRMVNNLDIYVRGSDNVIYQRQWDGHAWGGYYRRGGKAYSTPAAVSRYVGSEDIFYKSASGDLMHNYWSENAGWGFN